MLSDNQEFLNLVDAAARGNIEAARKLGEGYFKGTFDGKKNLEKAAKWLRYAAKHGDIKAEAILEQIE
ncbi:SEL1-like repeat protein [Butyrivibrio sp. MC2013]|uniref:SEL1-like repeat protein n=1 Tax=Butyrivibrio sp. MC2013 TaxID=1280686 RepID=UPI0003FDDD79|nr:SEL1-like repeat protein [Butyrivibrio sp. MC2013]